MADVDRLVEGDRYESRADLVRRAIDTLVRSEQRREADEATIAGYTRVPQTDEEAAWADGNLRRSIAEEPWEPWW